MDTGPCKLLFKSKTWIDNLNIFRVATNFIPVIIFKDFACISINYIYTLHYIRSCRRQTSLKTA